MKWSEVKSLQSCPTLCDLIDGNPTGSPIPGILQARTLEWVANSFSNAWKWKVKIKLLSRVWLSATPWTAAYQAPPSMGFSRQEYWSGVPLPSPKKCVYIYIYIYMCVCVCVCIPPDFIRKELKPKEVKRYTIYHRSKCWCSGNTTRSPVFQHSILLTSRDCLKF